MFLVTLSVCLLDILLIKGLKGRSTIRKSNIPKAARFVSDDTKKKKGKSPVDKLIRNYGHIVLI